MNIQTIRWNIDLQTRLIDSTFDWKRGSIGRLARVNQINGVHGYPKAKLTLNFWPRLNGRNARTLKTFAWWMLSTFWGVSAKKKSLFISWNRVEKDKLVTNFEEIFWTNNITILEFGYRMMWKIMHISEDVIHLGLQPGWITSCIILHILLSLIQ